MKKLYLRQRILIIICKRHLKGKFGIERFKTRCGFEIETLDKAHGNIYDDYVRIGAPHSPTHKEINYLKQAAWNTAKQIVKVASDGTLTWNSELTPWSCVLIREL